MGFTLNHKAGYEELAMSIIKIAVHDFNRSYKACRRREIEDKPFNWKADWVRRDCEHFFKSQYFSNLTNYADGNVKLNKLIDDCEKELSDEYDL